MATTTSKEDKPVQLGVNVRPALKKDLQEAAWRHRLTLRGLVEQIFDEWLEKECKTQQSA